MSDASQHSALLDNMEHIPVVDPGASTLSPEARAVPMAPIMKVNRNWVPPQAVGDHGYATPSRWFG
jgi:hypothetical protein